jgi:hydroxyacylglutathione hydrolase
MLLTGDALFAGGSGRCDLAGGSRAEADASLQSALPQLPDDRLVLPGHGGVTTVGRERGRTVTRPTLAA